MDIDDLQSSYTDIKNECTDNGIDDENNGDDISEDDENEINRKFDEKYNITISNKARYVYTVNDSVEMQLDKKSKQQILLDKNKEKQDILIKNIEKLQTRIIDETDKNKIYTDKEKEKNEIKLLKLNALKHKLNLLNKEYETLSNLEKFNSNSNNYLGECQLTNGYYFKKEPKSDEKLYYTEKDITQIIRTILIIYVFEIKIKETINDVIFNQKITVLHSKNKLTKKLSIQILINVIDTLLGAGFCSIAKRPVMNVYAQYMNIWRYYDFGQCVQLVSATDIINLYQFYNIANTKLCGATQFVIENNTDNEPTQSLIKHIL